MNHLLRRTAWTVIGLALTALPSLAQSIYENYSFTTLAGPPAYLTLDGTGSVARFDFPQGVAVDSAGNVFVADSSSHTIRKVTPAGEVTTLAGRAGSVGTANGTGNNARFNHPAGVAADSAGNVFVADSGNHTIRKVTPAGVVTTLAGLAENSGSADGMGNIGRFNRPFGLAVDNKGNIFVAESGGNRIRKVTPAGLVTTLASDARFPEVSGVAVDSAGNIFVADDNRIRRITPAGVVTNLAGLGRLDGNGVPPRGSIDGTASEARFSGPAGAAADSTGNLYVADSFNHTIRKITPAGEVTTLAGLAGSAGSTDGTGSAARFWNPVDVAVDGVGNLYVADSFNRTIRKVTPEGVVTTLAGQANGKGNVGAEEAGFDSPFGITVNSAGTIYVADTFNHTIRKMTPAGVIATLAGEVGSLGSTDGTGSGARFHAPTGLAMDNAGILYVADRFNDTIRKITPEGVVTTLAGQADSSGSKDGIGNGARFFWPSGVAVDSTGDIYVADQGNHTIRKLTREGTVTTLAGLAGSPGSADGTGSDARFNFPWGVAVDSAGNVYATDTDNHTIRKITPAGVVTTLAGLAGFANSGREDGTGSDARFSHPSGITVDGADNIFVADSYNNTIRKVTPAGVVTTLAGLVGFGGKVDGAGNAARFSYPQGVAVDSAGVLYVADTSNSAIRKGFPAATIPTSRPGFGFSSGQFGFNLTGPVGRAVVVEVSTDFVNWLPLWTNTFSGALDFSDPQSGGTSGRFYRARLP